MNQNKLTTEEVAGIIESEGLGYAVQSYLSADRIADPDLAELWKKASTLLDEIEEFCEDFLE